MPGSDGAPLRVVPRLLYRQAEDDIVSAIDSNQHKTVYWHSELPPFDAEAMGEHVVEATSGRLPSTLARRDEVWNRCYEELMAQAHARLTQEIARLGGEYAHVLDESVDSRHDDVTGESWLHGRFSYILYRRPKIVGKINPR